MRRCGEEAPQVSHWPLLLTNQMRAGLQAATAGGLLGLTAGHLEEAGQELTLRPWTRGGASQEDRKRAALWEDWAWHALSITHWCCTSSPGTRRTDLHHRDRFCMAA